MPTKPDDREVLVDVNDMQVHYALRGNALSRLFGAGGAVVKAVDGVNFQLRRGEVLGLVGESGSGKTTLGRALLGLVRPTAGSIVHDDRDVGTMPERKLRPFRRRSQMIFQDPSAALNPSMDIETAVGDPLRMHGEGTTRAGRRERVSQVLERVGLSPVEQFLPKYPGDLSGGQKQRAVFARALILGPELVVADEPISMLDMSVRAKLLELMLELKQDLDLTYVYITHDLATAKFLCDRVAIMYLGRVVEIGSTEEIFSNPKHPYTKALLKAVPEPDPSLSVARDLPRGEIPDAVAPPLGCAFHPRCPSAFERCGWETRDLRTMLEEHWLSVPPEEYEQERAIVGNAEELERAETSATLKPGRSAKPQQVEELLDRIRAADPDEPMWSGVEQLTTDDHGVAVRFAAGDDPALRRAGEVDVACHLYPEE